MRNLKKLHLTKLVLTSSIAFIIQITNGMGQTLDRKVDEPKGLPIGATVEDFTATDQHDQSFSLYKNLKNGPVVVLFYRGQWCPVCNKHLTQFEDSLQLIYDKGATVVAISPERPQLLKVTAKKTSASFTLLHDEAYKISHAFDVTCNPDAKTVSLYNTRLDANLSQAHSDASQRLPIPATFVIDQEGKIIWRHFNPDDKKKSYNQTNTEST